MARKTILTLALAGATLAAIPALAQTAAPAAPDCAADPAACQALVDRMGATAARGGEGERSPGDRGLPREGRRGHHDDGRARHEGRDGHRGGDEHRGPWQAGTFGRFDSNADGTVTADEASAGIAALLAQFDANADQALTIDEFAALHAELMKPAAARSFGMIDTNADGRVDAAEAEAVAQRMGRDAPPAAPAPAAAAPATGATAGAAAGAADAPAATPGN